MRRKTSKWANRALAGMLAFLMVVSLVPMGVSAEEADDAAVVAEESVDAAVVAEESVDAAVIAEELADAVDADQETLSTVPEDGQEADAASTQEELTFGETAPVPTETAEDEENLESAEIAEDGISLEQPVAADDMVQLMQAEVQADEPEIFDEAYQKTAEALSAAADQYTIQVGSTGGEWMTIGLARAGVLTDAQAEAYYANVETYVESKINDKEQLHRSKSTENSRVILGLTAIGMDVTDVAGHNLLAGFTDMGYVKAQGINGPIWALIAFDSHNYEILEGADVIREDMIAYILGRQLTDGGWALSGTSADPDMTAMAIQALAPYYETDSTVREAVDKALTCLSKIQKDNGGYASWGTVNSESCAQVVVALTALGIDPSTDSRFVKNGKSVLDALLSFYVEGGGFRHTADTGYNGMATEQGYYALVAYRRFSEGKTRLYDMNDVVLKGDAGEDPDTPDQPENPENPDTPDQPENPDTPNQPENPENPDTPNQPENPGTPNQPGKPDTPDQPENPENPDTPNQPENPGTPNQPENPNQPGNPSQPENPNQPGNPNQSGNPGQPSGTNNSGNQNGGQNPSGGTSQTGTRKPGGTTQTTAAANPETATDDTEAVVALADIPESENVDLTEDTTIENENVPLASGEETGLVKRDDANGLESVDAGIQAAGMTGGSWYIWIIVAAAAAAVLVAVIILKKKQQIHE